MQLFFMTKMSSSLAFMAVRLLFWRDKIYERKVKLASDVSAYWAVSHVCGSHGLGAKTFFNINAYPENGAVMIFTQQKTNHVIDLSFL